MWVEWAEPALEDMTAIQEYVAADTPENANRFICRLFDSAAPLTDFPQSGRQVPEANNRDDVHELIFQDYRIILRIKKIA